MAFIGKIEPFDETTETWSAYVERLEQYFTVNEIKTAKKVPALLTLLGSKTYNLLRNLTAPEKPSELDYDTIVELLEKQLSPKPSVITQRYRFHTRIQNEGETINDYVAQLRKLAIHCNFDNLNDTLRDRLVCGIRNTGIQKRLLSESTLPLEKAITISVAMEMAAKDAIELQGKLKEVRVNKITQAKSSRVSHNNQSKARENACFRCGKPGHQSNSCKHKEATCYYCKKKGHIEKACLTKRRQQTHRQARRNVHAIDNTVDNEDESDSDNDLPVGSLEINSMKEKKAKPIQLEMNINGKKVPMELDTGSAISVMSKEKFEKHVGKAEMTPTKVVLKTSGEKIHPLGITRVKVRYQKQEKDLDLYLVEKGTAALFGRDWLAAIQLEWKEIRDVLAVKKETVSTNIELDQILSKYATVFEEGIGKVKDIKATLKFKEQPQPVFCKARQIPYALRPKVEQELDELEKMGIISKVETSEWATPIVPVLKKNGRVRVCGDFKLTINPQLAVDQYPLPRIEDVFASLADGEKFTKIDLRQAYLHMEMEEESKKYLTVNTHKGLYQFNRMLFGIASAPAIWQRTMEQILQGIPSVQCILDDMIITGKNDAEHLNNLESVLSRLQQYQLKANLDKCQFFKDEIDYCGHKIDKNGIHKTEEKVKAVRDTPAPENVTQLRAFIGLVNYYHRFLPDLASTMRPLHQLLEKDQAWKWTKRCDDACKKVKEMVTSDLVLCHHDPKKPIRLACDASPYGVGAVLSHIIDGQERPIAFASRTLTKTERNYSQIDKEALAIIFGIKRFHAYLYGRHFTLITDHQPLVSIFSPTKGIPVTSAARLQRYAMFLSGYTYDIEYRNTKRHTNADALSRLPFEVTPEDEKEEAVDVFHLSQFEQLPVTSATIRRETSRDKVLNKVYEQTMSGWSTKPDDKELLAYYHRRDEITTYQGCLMWGIRVIIPGTLRQQVLEVIHSTHLGVVKMKAIARSHVWWPGIDSEIERITKTCPGCNKVQNNPTKAPIHPWEWPSSPWERIHVDFAGPFMDKQFLIIVDAHSKWPEVFPMKKITAASTIEVLRSVFARNGVPQQLVSDNGPQFTSEEFQAFMKSNGIHHFRSAPFHPATNGQAERFVQTFKQSMKAMKSESASLNKKIANFLLMYRNTPHATTNETPAKMFLGRNLRSRLDLMKPDIKGTVQQKQMKKALEKRTPIRLFDNGQPVTVRDYRGQNKWMNGTVSAQLGPLMYEVKTAAGSYWRRHTDQIQERKEDVKQSDLPPVADIYPSAEAEERPDTTATAANAAQGGQQEGRRYPARNRKPPRRYMFEQS